MLQSVFAPLRGGLQRPVLAGSAAVVPAARTAGAAAQPVGVRSLATSVPAAAFPRFSRPQRRPPRTPLTHHIYIQSTRNNTIITFTDLTGRNLLTRSGGQVGFKGAQRNGYEAAYRATFAIFNKIAEEGEELGVEGIGVHFKCFGQGREAFFRALITPEAAHVKERVVQMSDRTPLRIGGCRPPLPRSMWICLFELLYSADSDCVLFSRDLILFYHCGHANSSPFDVPNCLLLRWCEGMEHSTQHF